MATTHDERCRWWKSSASGNGNCVEVAMPDTDTVLVRQSKDPEGTHLAFSAREWKGFITGVKAGELDSRG